MQNRSSVLGDRERGKVVLLEGSQMSRGTAYSRGTKGWEYCYCRDCKTIRYTSDLEINSERLQCLKCGGFDLEVPRWVDCPHRKGAVKCVFGGTGLARGKGGYECRDRCKFF